MKNSRLLGNKGGGGWNKAKTLDYSMLKRYSVAYLLRLMRLKQPTPEQDNRQFKTALEVVTKDIGKQVTQAGPTVNQFFFQTLLERAGVLSESRYDPIARN
jgi:hypothetical protein